LKGVLGKAVDFFIEALKHYNIEALKKEATLADNLFEFI